MPSRRSDKGNLRAFKHGNGFAHLQSRTGRVAALRRGHMSHKNISLRSLAVAELLTGFSTSLIALTPIPMILVLREWVVLPCVPHTGSWSLRLLRCLRVAKKPTHPEQAGRRVPAAPVERMAEREPAAPARLQARAAVLRRARAVAAEAAARWGLAVLPPTEVPQAAAEPRPVRAGQWSRCLAVQAYRRRRSFRE